MEKKDPRENEIRRMLSGRHVFVTGADGFIGSHLLDKLVEMGHDVVVIDNLEPQVHQGKQPDYLNYL